MSTISAKKLQICRGAPNNARKKGVLTLEQRLQVLRGGMTFRQFADRVGVRPYTVRRYEQGRSRVPLEYVEAVCGALGVSADWLIFGVEAAAVPMEPLARAVREDIAPVKRSVVINGERVRIVCVPVLNRVPAGAPAEMLDDMPVGFGLEGVIRVPDPGDANAYALTAWGDSMEPLIHDGERIVVSPRRAHGFSAGIAVVRIAGGQNSPGGQSSPVGQNSPGGELCVKHVRMRGGRVEITPANPRYPGMVLAAEEGGWWTSRYSEPPAGRPATRRPAGVEAGSRAKPT